MNLGRPFSVVTPTLDGDVLSVLAGADAAFTAPQVHRLLARHSVEGVRNVLVRLTHEGIVTGDRVGRAVSYRLNRNHLAAPHVVAIAQLRDALLVRLRETIERWEIPPVFAALFGSAATAAMHADSDLDICVVRGDDIDPDAPVWRAELDDLAAAATEWTGNDTRLLEVAEPEVARGIRSNDALFTDIRDEGLRLYGPPSYLHRRRSSRA